jgi:hypothetical protein
MQGASKAVDAAQAAANAAHVVVAQEEGKMKAVTNELTERKAAAPANAPLPVVPPNVDALTVAELQAELSSHGQNTDWDPTKGKAVLVERLTVRVSTCSQQWKVWARLQRDSAPENSVWCEEGGAAMPAVRCTSKALLLVANYWCGSGVLTLCACTVRAEPHKQSLPMAVLPLAQVRRLADVCNEASLRSLEAINCSLPERQCRFITHASAVSQCSERPAITGQCQTPGSHKVIESCCCCNVSENLLQLMCHFPSNTLPLPTMGSREPKRAPKIGVCRGLEHSNKRVFHRLVYERAHSMLRALAPGFVLRTATRAMCTDV